MTHLYMPITSQPRELDSKLLLALFAREAGMTPVIGYKSTFASWMGRLMPGVFLAHNARQKPHKINLLRKYGHWVAVLDEEALVRQSDEIFLKKHPVDAFGPVNQVLCWGDDDLEMWRQSGLAKHCNFAVVGNPRMDILRAELLKYSADKVESLRNSYGNYILLNTNFPTVNNLTPQGGGMRLANWARDDRGAQVEGAFLANKVEMFNAMLDLIKPLAAAIAPQTLVIRPHPNEDHAPWVKASAGAPNVVVTFDGPVVPWIIGAHALVHNSCTTAVEAAVSGTPVLNFTPWPTEYDNPLAHAVGQNCPDLAALTAAIAGIAAGTSGGPSDAQMARLQHHIANVTGPFSCERIVALMTAPGYLADRSSRIATIELFWMDLRRWALRYWRLARFLVTKTGQNKRRFLREKFPDFSILDLDFEMLIYNDDQLDLLMRQFPPLSEQILDRMIAQFSASLGRFHGIRSVKLGHNLFEIR